MYMEQQWMEGWIAISRPFNSVSVTSERWEGDYGRTPLQLESWLSPAGVKLETPRSTG